MNRHLAGRMTAALAAAAALLTSGGIAASAQAATGSPHSNMATRPITGRPSADLDFTCPSRTVCLFPNDNYTGNYPGWGGPAELATDVWNGQWYSFAQADASNPNPGSLNDNSNSVIWVYAKDLNLALCLTPGRYSLDHTYGYFFIQFGVTSCNANPPMPLP